ncbi:MAG: hypothetical protein K8S14_06250 [Actinomycetia bacterium]|nr:hypothetical protein [Actinomycetes bacterium]
MKIMKYTGIAAVLLLLLCSSLFVFSCGIPAAEIPGNEEENAPGFTEEELEQLKEGFAEEEAEIVNYDNALIGAEFYGYMPSYLCTDTDNYVKIEVTNTSDFTWRAKGKNMVRLGYHFYGQDVDFTEYDKTTRSVLPENLEPGETATVEVLINDITNPGTYVVQIDLVLEGHFWFSSRDIPMIEARVFFGSCINDE